MRAAQRGPELTRFFNGESETCLVFVSPLIKEPCENLNLEWPSYAFSARTAHKKNPPHYPQTLTALLQVVPENSFVKNKKGAETLAVFDPSVKIKLKRSFQITLWKKLLYGQSFYTSAMCFGPTWPFVQATSCTVA